MGRIISLTGPSGVGKTTIARELIGRSPSQFSMVESLTTRLRRTTDLKGEYRHLEREDFTLLSLEGKLLWETHFAHNRYGTRAESILEAIAADSLHVGVMILVPNVISTLQKFLREHSALYAYTPFFIDAPTATIEKRLKKRGDAEVDIARRAAEASEWAAQAESSPIPYRFVSNVGSIANSASEVWNGIR